MGNALYFIYVPGIFFSLNHRNQFENQTSYPWEVPHMCIVQQKSKNPYCYAPPINQKK
jgi:hypothetical protein